jgi:hypothetical protein
LLNKTPLGVSSLLTAYLSLSLTKTLVCLWRANKIGYAHVKPL